MTRGQRHEGNPIRSSTHPRPLPSIRVLVLSEFCVPLVFEVPADVTVEHVKAKFAR